MQENNMDELQMLARHEDVLRQLYEVYAEKLPQMRDFWRRIASEEKAHAGWIEKIHAKVLSGELRQVSNRFNPENIRYSTKYIREQINRASKDEISQGVAIYVALGLERSMIEGKWFEVLKQDSEDVSNLVAALGKATNEHLAQVWKLWEQQTK